MLSGYHFFFFSYIILEILNINLERFSKAFGLYAISFLGIFTQFDIP
jgi:hypothetical protein